jgi:hypothetical protein
MFAATFSGEPQFWQRTLAVSGAKVELIASQFEPNFELRSILDLTSKSKSFDDSGRSQPLHSHLPPMLRAP